MAHRWQGASSQTDKEGEHLFGLVSYPWSQAARFYPERRLLVRGDCLCGWDLNSKKIIPLVVKSGGVVLFERNRTIAPKGDYVYYLEDDGFGGAGSELGHVMRVPFEGGPAEDITPGVPWYALVGIEASAGDTVAINPVTRRGFETWVISLRDLTRIELHLTEHESGGVVIDRRGKLVCIYTREFSEGGPRGLLLYDVPARELVAALPGEEDFWPCCFASGISSELEPQLLVCGWNGMRRQPAIWKPYTGNLVWLDIGQQSDYVIPLDWALDNDTVLLYSIARGRERLLLHKLSSGDTSSVPHPPGSIGEYGGTYGRFAYFAGKSKVCYHRQDSLTPPQVEEIGDHGKLQVVLPSLSVSGRAWTAVVFSVGEKEIQGWLATPPGKGPFPALIYLHGGPHLVLTEAFYPEVLTWIRAGFAWLGINYRGSTAFGREFESVLTGRLGEYELVDMLAARDFLVQKGVSWEQGVFLCGESYGGYLTLWGLARAPMAWAGGMAALALADWKSAYEDASPALRGSYRYWFGGSPDEVPERYKMSSPLSYMADIQAPLHVYHGVRDTRTPFGQIKDFCSKMLAIGKKVVFDRFEGGHLLTMDLRADLQRKRLKFCRQVLSGYQ